MADREPEQLSLMRELVELSAERSYMNAERTLSVWVRTALAVMVVGIAVDRFGLLLSEHQQARPDTASHWVGVALVAFGIVIAALTAGRFRLYAAAYRRTHELPYHHGPFMAPAFAVLAAAFGVVILVLLLVAR